jgi:hypothetical protein
MHVITIKGRKHKYLNGSNLVAGWKRLTSKPWGKLHKFFIIDFINNACWNFLRKWNPQSFRQFSYWRLLSLCLLKSSQVLETLQAFSIQQPTKPFSPKQVGVGTTSIFYHLKYWTRIPRKTSAYLHVWLLCITSHNARFVVWVNVWSWISFCDRVI